MSQFDGCIVEYYNWKKWWANEITLSGKPHIVELAGINIFSCHNDYLCTSNGGYRHKEIVISICHFLPCFSLQSLQFFLSFRLDQEQVYVLNALKISRPSNYGEAGSAASRKARKPVGKSWNGEDALTF